jgi:hypothetical protein
MASVAIMVVPAAYGGADILEIRRLSRDRESVVDVQRLAAGKALDLEFAEGEAFEFVAIAAEAAA